MNRKVLLLIVVLATAWPTQAQTRADSLRSALVEARGLERAEVLLELMREQYSTDPALVARYGHEALALLERSPDPEIRADVLYYLSMALHRREERDSALVYAEQARDEAASGVAVRIRERSGTVRLSVRQGEAERFIGHIYHDWGRYSESEAAFRRAMDLFEATGDRENIATTNDHFAVLYKTQGRYSEAISHHKTAMAAFEALGLEHEAARSLNGLAVVYTLSGRYGEALESLFRVLQSNERLGSLEDVATSYSNIGGVYELTHDYEQALEYYERAREIYESGGKKRRLATAFTNVGSALFHLERYKEAIESYETADSLARETQNVRLLAYIHEGLGRVHEKQGGRLQARAAFEAALAGFETLGERRGLSTALISLGRLRRDDEGISMIRRAVQIAREMNSYELLREGNALLAELYSDGGRHAEALEAYKEFKAAHDSLYNAESRTTLARLDTEYRTKEQQQQIELLEQKRQVQRLWLFGLLSGVALLGIITGLSFNRVRLRQRALAALEQAHRAKAEQARLASEAAEARTRYLQVENERKTEELDAARRLQLSMLPKTVPGHPVVEIATLMRTAAEVGGDYYDFHVGEDGALTIAIGDATGHGTRAGTMVAAAKSLFSNYADEPDLARALRLSARAVRRMALPNLYMALALVRVREHEMELAGAGMPPALVYRAGSGTVDRVALKGTPLGAPIESSPEKQRVRIAPGDAIVLMSDGFPELRNHAGEQVGYEAVARIVEEAGCWSAECITQRFEEAIQAWSGEKPIEDDITFVVMKVR